MTVEWKLWILMLAGLLNVIDVLHVDMKLFKDSPFGFCNLVTLPCGSNGSADAPMLKN